MTVAEYCVFAAVALYLLTIVPIKWMALREFKAAAIRPSYRDAIRARAAHG